MPKLKNINPVGDIDLPLLGRIVAAGEVFEVTDDQATALLQQVGNYEAVSSAKKKDD